MIQHPTLDGSASCHAEGHLSVDVVVEPGPNPTGTASIRARLDLENAQIVRIQHRHLEHGGVAHPAQQARPPRVCELLMCLAVEPEFQEDRLADFQERFSNLWVPRFGRRGAVAIYVWHVLRQSRLIDWLIRAIGRGDPL
jgi:hypothetical protein